MQKVPAAYEGLPARQSSSGPFNVRKIVHVIDGPHGAPDAFEGNILGTLYCRAIGQSHGVVCRFRYEVGVEVPHLHHYDIVVVEINTCCIELFHRAALDRFRHDKHVYRRAIDVHYSTLPYRMKLPEPHDSISNADDGSL